MNQNEESPFFAGITFESLFDAVNASENREQLDAAISASKQLSSIRKDAIKTES